MTEFKKGDKVKVTFEGVVTYGGRRWLDVEDASGDLTTVHVANVEKIEPPVTTFKPGDVVREKAFPEAVYALGRNEYLRIGTNCQGNGFKAFSYDQGQVLPFTSEYYQLVNINPEVSE